MLICPFVHFLRVQVKGRFRTSFTFYTEDSIFSYGKLSKIHNFTFASNCARSESNSVERDFVSCPLAPHQWTVFFDFFSTNPIPARKKEERLAGITKVAPFKLI